MFTVVIIIVLGIAGAAALAIWLVDERGKMRGWREVRDDWREFDKTMAEFGYTYPPKPPPRPWTEEKIEKWLARYPTGSGASEPKYDGAHCVLRRQGDTVLVENAPLTEDCRKKIEDWLDEARGAIVDTPEARAAYTLQTRKTAIEIATGRPWHPLPMEELRREWED